MFRRLYEWTLRQAASPRAEGVLATISFAESSVFPIPSEILFVPMCLARPDKVMRYALVASVTSVLGGIAGWMIGHFAFEALALPILELYGKTAAFEALKDATGTGTILILLVTSGAAHLPPMKVVTILSGLISFSLPLFILSAIVARGGKYFLLAWAIRKWGAAVVDVIERRFKWAALAVMVAAILGYAALKLA